MSLIEFIGFVISMLALIILSARQAREQRRRNADPEAYEREQMAKDRSLRELLNSMNIQLEEGEEEDFDSDEMDEERFVQRLEEPQTPVTSQGDTWRGTSRQVKSGFALRSQVEERQLTIPVERRRLASPITQRKIGRQVVSTDMAPEQVDAYAIGQRKKRVNVRETMRRLNSPQEMIILHEILSPPKGLRH